MSSLMKKEQPSFRQTLHLSENSALLAAAATTPITDRPVLPIESLHRPSPTVTKETLPMSSTLWNEHSDTERTASMESSSSGASYYLHEDEDDEHRALGVSSSDTKKKLKIRFRRSEQEQLLQDTYVCRRRKDEEAQQQQNIPEPPQQRTTSHLSRATSSTPALHSSTLSTATLSCVCITGPTGSGKTHLAKAALAPLVHAQGGFFLTGTFDCTQLQAPLPYIAFTQAFTEWTRLVVQHGPEMVEHMRDTIKTAFGDDKTSLMWLMSMIPALCELFDCSCMGLDENGPSIGAGCAVMQAKESLQRFIFVLNTFLQAICTKEHPVVLLLDDLQYADPCSLDVLVSVISTTTNLFLVGTCDDNVLPAKSYLAAKLREMEVQSDSSVVHIKLNDLDTESLDCLVKETLEVNDNVEQVSSLSRLILEQTQGSLFYVEAFMQWLVENELLEWDSSSGSWRWDVEEIKLGMPSTAASGVEFVKKHQLEPLPHMVKELLKVAACLCTKLDMHLVECALGTNVEVLIQDAVRRGILVKNESKGGYVFVHENIKKAAYNLVADSERDLFHLEIGRRVWRQLTSTEVEHHIFIILALMQHGKHLITREKERLAVANLCLTAGTRAARSSTFRAAAIYLEFGIFMLQERSWRDEYELTLALYNFTAEVQMCTAKFERMHELVASIISHARVLEDKVPAYCTLIYALGTQGEDDKSISTAIEVLKGLGETFPGRLCSFQMNKLYCHVKKGLRGKSNEMILRMPTMSCPKKLASLRVLHLVFLTALLSRPGFTPFVVLKMMDITLQHGLSSFASLAFAYFGMIHLQHLDDVDSAFRFGELSLALLDRFKANEFIPRVYSAFYGCIFPRRKPIQETLDPLWNAHMIGMQTGDLNGAFICSNLWAMNAWECNVPLPVIAKKMKKCRHLMKFHRQTTQLAIIQPRIKTADCLMGLSDDLNFDQDMDEVLVRNSEVTGGTIIPIFQMEVSFFFNEYEPAEQIQTDILNTFHRLPPSFKQISSRFLAGLSALIQARKGIRARKNKRFGKQMIERFQRMYALESPHNSLGMLFLLEAEYLALKDKNAQAFVKYTAAIAMAEANDRWYLRAVSYERTARHLIAVGESSMAWGYFDKAIDAYKSWGALRKVETLENDRNKLCKLSTTCYG